MKNNQKPSTTIIVIRNFITLQNKRSAMIVVVKPFMRDSSCSLIGAFRQSFIVLLNNLLLHSFLYVCLFACVFVLLFVHSCIH